MQAARIRYELLDTRPIFRYLTFRMNAPRLPLVRGR